jgi:hypothetical protein
MDELLNMLSNRVLKGRRRISAVLRGAVLGLEGSRVHDRPGQKSRPRIVCEMAVHALRDGQPHEDYFLFEDDRAGRPFGARPTKRAAMDIIHRQIDAQSAHVQAALLRDKIRFSEFLTAHQLPGARVLGISRDDKVYTSQGDVLPLSEFIDQTNEPFFAKPVDGAGGSGAHIVYPNLAAGDMEVPSEQREAAGHIGDSFLFQALISQHPDLSTLYSGSINTVRLVTVRSGEGVSAIGAILRVGALGSVTDNVSGGGLAVPVDLRSGRLKPNGIWRIRNLKSVTAHPDSGRAFEGFAIPLFSEALMLVARAHMSLGPLPTVGWDVAITPEGPLLVEGNAFWTMRTHLVGDPDFLPRYAKAVSPWLCTKDMIWARPYLCAGPRPVPVRSHLG